MPGRENAKGKKYSHRPKRNLDAVRIDGKWYQKKLKEDTNDV